MRYCKVVLLVHVESHIAEFWFILIIHYSLRTIVNHQTGASLAPGRQFSVLAWVDAVGDCTCYQS